MPDPKDDISGFYLSANQRANRAAGGPGLEPRADAQTVQLVKQLFGEDAYSQVYGTGNMQQNVGQGAELLLVKGMSPSDVVKTIKGQGQDIHLSSPKADATEQNFVDAISRQLLQRRKAGTR